MDYFLGIDLGTTNIKATLIDIEGKYLGSSEEGYPIISLHPGWAEQDPLLWWKKTIEVVNKVITKTGIKKSSIKGIGFSGQMHGIVPIDKNGDPLYNAIIWADQRVYKEVEFLKSHIPKEIFSKKIGNFPNSGFTAPKIMWFKKNRPELYKKTYKFLFPKDFIRHKITKDVYTEYSDASASLLFDLKEKTWSFEIMELLNLDIDKMPSIVKSSDITGEVTKEFSILTGIPEGTKVVAGGGDQPCTALGNFVLSEDTALVTVGTGGQLFYPVDTFKVDPKLRVHTLLHVVENTYYIMGAIQSAGASLKWWMDNITDEFTYNDIDNTPPSQPGAKGMLFTPYLFGERTPHMDDKIKASFVGVSFSHTREDFIRAIMEGVSFAIREGKEIIENLKRKPRKYFLAGGITKSKTWSQIISNILKEELYILEGEEKAAYGASLLALMGSLGKENLSFNPQIKTHIYPEKKYFSLYDELFSVYKEIYVTHKDIDYKIFSIFQKGAKDENLT